MKKTKILSFASLPLAMALLAGCGHEHTFSDAWNHDENKHWHDATCEHKDQVKDEGPHVDGNNDGKCDVCDFEMPIYKVTKEEWEAAFGLEKPYKIAENYKIDMETISEDELKIGSSYRSLSVDGLKARKVRAKTAGEHDAEYTLKTQNGFASYFWNESQQKWEINEEAGDPTNEFASFLTPFGTNFDKFIFDDNSKLYKCLTLDVGGTICTNMSIKFDNKKIVSASLESAWKMGTDSVNYHWQSTITYGGQTVTLPDVPTPPVVDPHKVDEAGWYKAFGSKTYLFMFADNYKSSISMTGEGPMVGDITLTVEDNKLKSEVGEKLLYYSLEENVPYCYSKTGEKWAKTAMRSESDLTAAVSIYFEPLGDYSAFTYDEASHSYKAESTLDEMCTNLVVSFTDGKVMSASYDMSNPTEPSQVCHFESSFVYGGQTVTLPDVPQEGVDLAKAKQVMGSFLNYFEKQDIEKAMPKRSEVRISDFLNKDLVPGTFDTVNYVGQALMYAKVAELFMNKVVDYDSSKILQGVISEDGMSMALNLRFNVVTNGDDSELTVDISFDSPEIGGLGGVHLVAHQENGVLGNFELYSSAVGGGSFNEKRFYYDDLIFKQGDSLKAGRFIVDQDTKEVVHEDGTFAQEIVNEGHNLFMANITPFVDYIKDNTDKITTVDNFMETFYQAAMYYQELINSFVPPTPGQPVYAYSINGGDYVVLPHNEEQLDYDEYFVKDLGVSEGDKITIANIVNPTDPTVFQDLTVEGATDAFEFVDNALICKISGTYDLYLKPSLEGNSIYISAFVPPTPVVSNFQILVNDNAINLTQNESPIDPSFTEWFITGLHLNENDVIRFRDNTQPVVTDFDILNLDPTSAPGCEVIDGVIKCTSEGDYDFYLKLKYGEDQVYIGIAAK